MSNESSDWVRGGTPREGEADWDGKPSEYGTAVDQEWDDYASEQSEPVAAPQPRAAQPQPVQPTGTAQPTQPVTTPQHSAVQPPLSQQDLPEQQAAGTSERAFAAQQPLAGLGQQPQTSAQAQPASSAVDTQTTQQPVTGRDQEDLVPAPTRGVAEDYDPARDQSQRDALLSPVERPEHQATTAELPDEERPLPTEPEAFPAHARPAELASQTVAEAPAAPMSSQVQHVAAGDPAQRLVTGRTTPPVVITEQVDEPTVVNPHQAPVEPAAPQVATAQPVVEETVVRHETTQPEPAAPQVATPQPVVEETAVQPEPTVPLTDSGAAQPGVGAVDQEVAQPEAAEPLPSVTEEPTEPQVAPVATSDADAAFRNPDRTAEDELEATQAVSTVQDPAATGVAGLAGVYRETEATEYTEPIETPAEVQELEERELAAQLAAEREARERRLGVVATSPENEVRVPFVAPKRYTDKFFPSLALFLLRLITAGLLGVASYKILAGGIDETTDFLAQQPLIPEPRMVAWGLGIGFGVMAVLFVVGMLTRLNGLLLTAVSVTSLVLLRWGSFNVFATGNEGFHGDKELLLAAVGLVFLCIGSGGWGIDAAVRRSRERAKAERLD